MLSLVRTRNRISDIMAWGFIETWVLVKQGWSNLGGCKKTNKAKEITSNGKHLMSIIKTGYRVDLHTWILISVSWRYRRRCRRLTTVVVVARLPCTFYYRRRLITPLKDRSNKTDHVWLSRIIIVVVVRLSRRSTNSVFVVIVIIIIEGLKPAPASRNGQANITDTSERDTEAAFCRFLCRKRYTRKRVYVTHHCCVWWGTLRPFEIQWVWRQWAVAPQPTHTADASSVVPNFSNIKFDVSWSSSGETR